jgi:hypothetical protein
MGQALAGSQQPQEGGPNNPEVAWWCKLLAKIIGTIAGIGKLNSPLGIPFPDPMIMIHFSLLDM